MKTIKQVRWLILIIIMSIFLFGCSAVVDIGDLGGERTTVTILYGSEKRAWLEPLVTEFNDASNETASGTRIVVEATAMGSIESARSIIDGLEQPTVWSPASSIYIPVANAEWRQSNTSDLVEGTPNDLVLSPVVIAMWKPMAEAIGWPNEPIGWSDIFELSTDPEGWAGYGYPEWGSFKFGHTHPNFSNSGVTSVLAEAYAGAGKVRGLEVADLDDPAVQEFMRVVEKSVIHYGRSTGFFADQLYGRGPSYLSAAVIYENLVVEQEAKRLAGQVSQIESVAIYPKEGTFWSNHPYAILNASWVTAEQREAAQLFEDFLLAQEQQVRAIEIGFRPADPSIPLTSPLDAQHGVDPTQPQTILEVPSADVTAHALEIWQQTKKPVDLTVVMDISGSMGGEKINAARQSLTQFIDLLDDGDRLQIVLFSDEIIEITPLSPLGEKRDDTKRRVSGIIEGGGTRLYDAVSDAYKDLLVNGDTNHIRAMVVLTDGQDTDSSLRLNDVIQQIGRTGEEGGNAPKLFTIAFGGDADTDVLQNMSNVTGGKQYSGDPRTINQIYAEIATFF